MGQSFFDFFRETTTVRLPYAMHKVGVRLEGEYIVSVALQFQENDMLDLDVSVAEGFPQGFQNVVMKVR